MSAALGGRLYRPTVSAIERVPTYITEVEEEKEKEKEKEEVDRQCVGFSMTEMSISITNTLDVSLLLQSKNNGGIHIYGNQNGAT